MSNDPTTTPTGEADMPQAGAKSGRGRSTPRYTGMMGDGTEVEQAFSGGSQAAGAMKEPRSFLDKDAAMDMAGKAKDAATEKLSVLTDKVNAMRDQMQQSADAARDWATKKAGAARDAAAGWGKAAAVLNPGCPGLSGHGVIHSTPRTMRPDASCSSERSDM